MKISILSFDLSHNCLGRAHMLAKALRDHFQVEIIGPQLGQGVWEPVRSDTSVTIKTIRNIFNFGEILDSTDGDIIYAIKPRFTSFAYGILKKVFHKKPLVLDIDDWEMGFVLDQPIRQTTAGILKFWHVNNVIDTFLLERLTGYADRITVSNSFLHKKFGGVIIPHFRDTTVFNPDKYDRNKLRKDLHIEDKKVILFLGTPRKHKGIDDIIAALDLIDTTDIIFLIVGIDENDRSVKISKRSYIKILGQQSFDKVPEFLSLADLVILQQQKSHSTAGQIPAKLFDAMAMNKPIIATRVSDMPQILKGCGIVIEPGDISALARSITFVTNNPQKARELGQKAREKCVTYYSQAAVKPKLLKIFESLYK